MEQPEFFQKGSLKKYFPAAGLIILTVVLMIVFKSNQGNINNLMEEGREALASLYTNNLKPLISKTNLTNEDVLNFALYKNLPLDKNKKQVLYIENETPDSEVLQIKPLVWRDDTNNYERLISHLALNEVEKAKLDSILDSHKSEIYENILFGSNNSIAVNRNIIDIRKLILLDLFDFLNSIRGKGEFEMSQIALEAGSDVELHDALRHERSETRDEFVFIAPDTVFQIAGEINEQELERSIASYKAGMKEAEKAMKDYGFSLKFDFPEVPDVPEAPPTPEFSILVNDADSSTFVKVFLPKVGIKSKPEIVIEKYQDKIESLNKEIEKLTVSADSISKTAYKSRANREDVNSGSFKFEFNLENLDDLITSSIELGLKSQDYKNWEEFGNKMDSLMKSFEFNINDSTLKDEISRFKKEAQKFKEETKKKKKN